MFAKPKSYRILDRSVDRSLLLAVFLIGCVSTSLCSNPLHAQGPENTLVVVNADSPESLAVANHYIQLRNIPAANVVYVDKVPRAKTSFESTNYRRFFNEILEPTLKAMRQRGIEKQIDCIAYSSGFPTRINVKAFVDKYLEQTGKTYNKMFHSHFASITSLTYFHQNAYSDKPTFIELSANRYANPHRMNFLANPFSERDGDQFDAAFRDMVAGDYSGAIKGFKKLIAKHPRQVSVIYAMARCLALNGQKEIAIKALKYAQSLGFAYRFAIVKDKAFAGLKNDQAFIEMVEQIDDLPLGLTPTRSFSSQYYWGPNGWSNGSADQGEKYLLSSILAIHGPKPTTVDLAASLNRLEASVGADGTNPDGNVYFADHKDPRSRTRSRQFAFAKKELEALGRSASVGSDIYPINDSRVIGVTMGSPKPIWSKSNSKFLPGAICDNFTSYGALWSIKFQTHIDEFLDAGAAGACGPVVEPYTMAAKVPTARWHAHYARGSTLAESFYQSVSGPFQILLAGDPLCCPFGKFPLFEITGLEEGAAVTKDFVLQITPAATSPPIKRYEIYYDGVLSAKLSDSNRIAVATDAMNDGYHEMRVVGVGDSVGENRTSHAVGFIVNRNNHLLDLSTPNPRIRLGSSMVVQADSSQGKRIQIRQNSRTIATVQSGKQARITAAQIGLGKSKLQAVVVLENGTSMRSKPVTVEVLR